MQRYRLEQMNHGWEQFSCDGSTSTIESTRYRPCRHECWTRLNVSTSRLESSPSTTIDDLFNRCTSEIGAGCTTVSEGMSHVWNVTNTE
jgi:hypothetical protein